MTWKQQRLATRVGFQRLATRVGFHVMLPDDKMKPGHTLWHPDNDLRPVKIPRTLTRWREILTPQPFSWRNSKLPCKWTVGWRPGALTLIPTSSVYPAPSNSTTKYPFHSPDRKEKAMKTSYVHCSTIHHSSTNHKQLKYSRGLSKEIILIMYMTYMYICRY